MFVFGAVFALLRGLPIASIFLMRHVLVSHMILRIYLNLLGAVPLKLVTFLKEFTAAGILEQQGGNWSFSHSYVQDYFAARADTNAATIIRVH
jgi:hypothetical protein